MGAATFALLPYANRIAHGELVHGGRTWRLPRNFGDHAHPLHGTGWKRPWSVENQRTDAIEMVLSHAADAHWPWAFTARQRIRLADAVQFDLQITNAAAEAAPVGAGFHPAFAACAATRLRTGVTGVWRIDADSLPTTLAAADVVLPELPDAVPVLRETLVDHCFTGWSRELHVEHAGFDGDLAVRLTATPGLEFLQLYMPPGKRWFCAEPMSQMPDAAHRTDTAATGLRLLAPGESLHAGMCIAVQE